jgi:predicted membrane protein
MIPQDELRSDLLAGLKIALSWVLSISAQDLAVWLSILYTCAMLYVLLRDKVFRKPRQRRIAVETQKGDFDESTR